jgi:hypothetical protein
MTLSEILRPAHFPVAAGLSPCAWELEAATNTITQDQEAQPPPLAACLGPEEALLQTTIVGVWDLFKHNPDNTINREEYEAFQLRLIRVMLPSMEAKHEQTLAANAWEQDSCGLDKMPFSFFATAMVRFAKMCTSSPSASDAAKFLQNVFDRITLLHVVKADGQVLEPPPSEFDVIFSPSDGNDEVDGVPPDIDIGAGIAVTIQGYYPAFTYSAKFCMSAKRTVGAEQPIIFDELLKKPDVPRAPNDSVSLKWAPLKDIVPLGYATIVILQQLAKDCAAQGSVAVNVEGVPGISSNSQAMVHVLTKDGFRGVSNSVSCKVVVKSPNSVADIPTAFVGGNTPIIFQHLLGIGLEPAQMQTYLKLRPPRTSPLYCIEKIRKNIGSAFVGNAPVNAAEAALPGCINACDPKAGNPNDLKLPAFSDMLAGTLDMDAETGLARRVRDESMIDHGSLTSLAAILVSPELAEKEKRDDGASAVMKDDPFGAGKKELGAKKSKDQESYSRPNFPVSAEGLNNDIQDALSIARTPPVTLWVFGECDATGEYKTEACRRLAKRMGIQWLKPAYLLELAVKTPSAQRSPLMQRCVETLQRGMVVSTVDALKLTLEMMGSTRCKTNGYILELPPLTEADREAVFELVEKTKQLSAASEVRLGETVMEFKFQTATPYTRLVMTDEAPPLPIMKPDSEPPPPEPEKPDEEEPPADEAPAAGEENADGEDADNAGNADAVESPEALVVDVAPVKEEVKVEVGCRVEVTKDLYTTQPGFEVVLGWVGTVESIDTVGDCLVRFDCKRPPPPEGDEGGDAEPKIDPNAPDVPIDGGARVKYVLH